MTPPLLPSSPAALLGAHRVTLLLSLVLVLLVVALLMVRNGYGIMMVLLTAGAVLAVTWLATPSVRAGFAYGVAWFLLFGGLRPVAELARSRTRAARRRRPGLTDADQLAWLTGLPGAIWVMLFALVAVAALALGARLLIPWPAHLPSALN
jgi:hypothetical protein